MPISPTNRSSRKSIEAEAVSCLEAAGQWPGAEHALEGLCLYFSELLSWNRRLNLTGCNSARQAVVKHLGDTLVLVSHLPAYVRSVIDIGTGAGIPGLILKILRPDLDVCLLDARRKRISFLTSVIAGMGLKRVWAVHGRAGEGKGHGCTGAPERFDMAVSQAVGALPELARMADEFVLANGLVVAMKGPGGIEEAGHCSAALEDMGWETSFFEAVTPLEGHRRCLVVLKRAAIVQVKQGA